MTPDGTNECGWISAGMVDGPGARNGALHCGVMPYLYVVRHGQPDFAGNYDSLTTLGQQQSAWLGEHFRARGLRFARVGCGTLQRQVETCELILRQLGDAPASTCDAGLNEYDHASLLNFFEGDRVQ